MTSITVHITSKAKEQALKSFLEANRISYTKGEEKALPYNLDLLKKIKRQEKLKGKVLPPNVRIWDFIK